GRHDHGARPRLTRAGADRALGRRRLPSGRARQTLADAEGGLMRPWSYELAGRFDEHVFVSDALRGNALGDPHERPLWVYVPPGYDGEPDRRYPSIYVIQGYTGQLDMWRNRAPFGSKTFP